MYLPRPDSKECFLKSLQNLHNLRVLALEYSHLADGSGDALMYILPVLKHPHFRLHLICRENQTPGKINPDLGCGGLEIPDTAWRCASVASPNLHVSMLFMRIRDYDNVRRFLTPSIPLREAYLQYGIDLLQFQRQDSDLTCFVRHLAYRYTHCLQTLTIYQWRSVTFPLRRILELMPGLVCLVYTGCVESELDLRRMLTIIAAGVCPNLKQIKILVQDEKDKKDYWKAVVSYLLDSFKDILKTLEIELCLDVYRI